jgi:hypothetical protein
MVNDDMSGLGGARSVRVLTPAGLGTYQWVTADSKQEFFSSLFALSAQARVARRALVFSRQGGSGRKEIRSVGAKAPVVQAGFARG